MPLPIPDEQYDTIILSDVLEHIKEPKTIWEEMNRVLAPDGILLLNVPFYYWLHEEPFDYHRFTKYALRSMAKESGFEVIQLESVGGVPEILADILAKTTIKIPLIGKFLAITMQRFTAFFIKTKFGNKISRKTSERFPLAYTLIARKL